VSFARGAIIERKRRLARYLSEQLDRLAPALERSRKLKSNRRLIDSVRSDKR
jgi:hypothetical protein